MNWKRKKIAKIQGENRATRIHLDEFIQNQYMVMMFDGRYNKECGFPATPFSTDTATTVYVTAIRAVLESIKDGERYRNITVDGIKEGLESFLAKEHGYWKSYPLR